VASNVTRWTRKHDDPVDVGSHENMLTTEHVGRHRLTGVVYRIPVDGQPKHITPVASALAVVQSDRAAT
jgi:hypothetical protein